MEDPWVLRTYEEPVDDEEDRHGEVIPGSWVDALPAVVRMVRLGGWRQ